jgi:hypothetical protein
LHLNIDATRWKMDSESLSRAVYALAGSTNPISSPVKEALDVIEDALDTYG